ncbi:MAG: helicase HerA-like domain-containing protein [Liquorilactobacillus hordei]|uniref:TraD/TraG TraM recognition site domain-containing protein n=3 Tax=Liquorilactobacillus TaxID=2767888 RepID=A0A3S6QXQ8_9LACO|nr:MULTISPECIES: helicase HerA-like domain-containing protein [Liquorilactobacillus]AUJ30937.1 hypothetical protein BSQ49_11800 [Liquorilactobacillus hordei]AUJ33343.1 hypothetical protein BSQ50_11935 [Liquorilactobacillus nagelii]
MFDFQKQDNSKKERTTSDEEIGSFIAWMFYGLFLLAAIGIFLPALVIALVVGSLAASSHKLKWLSFVSGISLILLLRFKIGALFQFLGLYQKILPGKLMHFFENVFNNGKTFSIDWYNWILMIFLGLVMALLVGIIIKKLVTNYFVNVKEEQSSRFLNSGRYRNIFKKRLSITNKQQEKWRKDTQNTNLYLGIDIKGNAIELPIKQLFTHELIQGTTGSGKTVAMLAQAEACMKAGLPVIYVEAKGDPQIEHDLGKLATKYGRKFKIFSDNTETTYNPIKNGSSSGVEERLMSVFDWSELFYKNVSDNMLLKVIKFMDTYGIKRDLPTLLEYLDFDNIWETLKSDSIKREVNVKRKVKTKDGKTGDTGLVGIGKTEEKAKYIEKKVVVYDLSEKAKKYTKLFFGKENFDDEDFKEFKENEANVMKNIYGLKVQIELLVISDLGYKLSETENSVDMTRFLETDDIVLFSFNSNNYGSLIPKLGRFVVSDVATAVTQKFNRSEFKGAVGFFDEWGSYANEKIIDVLAKARSAKFGAVLGVQSMEDLNTNGEGLDKRIRDNVNTFMLGRSNDPESADYVANLVGTYEDLDKTIMTEDKGSVFARIDTKSARGTIRSVNKFVVKPDNIKRLEDHSFYLITKGAKNEEEYARKVYTRNTMQGL